MQKIFILFLFLISTKADAQIIGDTAVCAGNIYTYTANIIGAVTYQWTTPAGWYNLQGQGTSSITINCNMNDSNLCVEGFDSLGVSVGVECLVTKFVGGGMGGLKAVTPSSTVCIPNPPIGIPSISISIVPDSSGGWGSGGSCGGACGGTINTNIILGVYHGNSFMGIPNGLPFQIFLGPGTYTFYIYAVDTTYGKNLPQAIIIGGSGCGSSSGNNAVTFTIPNFYIAPYGIYANGACIGTLIYIDWGSQLTAVSGFTITQISGCTKVPGGVIPTSTTWNYYFTCTTSGGCQAYGGVSGSATNCYISGDTVICSGKTYTYHATMPPWSAFYNWTLPAGWYGLTGQGSSTITVTANSNAGNVCCTYGVPQNFCLDTKFGDGNSAGWNVAPDTIHRCSSDTNPFTAQINTNGTGGGGACPVGCGNGVTHPNIIYGVYDSIWPNGIFKGVANGIDSILLPIVNQPYYVYQIDTTNGINPPQAILISGGCNVGTINNTIVHDTISSLPTIISSAPSVCIDSNVTISITSGIVNPQWTVAGGIILNNNISSIDVQPTSFQCTAFVSGIDSVTGCITSGSYLLMVDTCNSILLVGDSVICPGYTYTYTAIIPHATTYIWTIPNGWYDMSGQNTSQIIATANSNSGLISVTGFDSSGYLIASTSFDVDFKNCRNRDVIPSIFKTCKTDSFAANVHIGSLGTGSCQLGCGNGVQHTNIKYAAYDNVWPNGNFKGFVDGIPNISPVTPSGSLYVYKVDYSNGTNPVNAILIEGDCGTCNFNNVISIDTIPLSTVLTSTPMTACVGDTVIISDTNNFQNPSWINASNLNLLNANSNLAYAVVTGLNPSIDFEGVDSISGCAVISNYQMNNEVCFYPIASFHGNKTSFCEKQYVDFFDMSSNNPTSWSWTFNGGVPSSSIIQNPDSIYYALSGMYDVELITCNNYSCDTLLLINYIQEYLSPPTPIITANGGVFYSTPAVSYAWYSTSNPSVILSTDSFFIPTQAGDYFVIITDSNGCNASSGVISNTGLQQLFLENEFTITEVSPSVFVLNMKNIITDGTVTFSDSQGKVLLKEKIKSQIQFDLRNYSKGIYFLKIQIENKIYSKKLMVI